MTTQLLLLRHADAGDPGGWKGDDAARPLSDKGVRQAEHLGAHLARLGFSPDAILSSPKARALQTAELVGAALGREVRVDERLGEGLGLGAVERVLRDAGRPDRALLVGHDPDFSELATTLTAAGAIRMKKGALARIDLVVGLAPGGGELRWLLPPDLVPGEG